MSISRRSMVYGRGQDDVLVQAAAPAAAGTFTPNVQNANRFVITMPAGNITVAAPLNPRLGLELDIEIVQDATGSRTVTWNAIYHFAGAAAPTLTTTASRRDTFRFIYNGTSWNEIARTLNVA
jgi:glyceraldehyde-3-phosphate dehydrogenase/erythrose-4-phosphate dehydrogenase